MLRPGNTCCSVLCSRATGTTSSSQAMLCNIHRCVLTSIISHQTSLFILNHLNFMYQAKKFGAETLFIPYFSSLCPQSHSPCPPGVCSHHNFSVRASFAERELLKWATLRQYKLAFQELFTKSFVTALILTGSTWLKSFVHSYSRDKNATSTQAAEKSPSCCILGCYVISTL